MRDVPGFNPTAGRGYGEVTELRNCRLVDDLLNARDKPVTIVGDDSAKGAWLLVSAIALFFAAVSVVLRAHGPFDHLHRHVGAYGTVGDTCRVSDT